MGGKAKPTKHSAKEIAKKAHDATCNRGGGGEGLKDRQGGAAGHAKYKCPHCGTQAPDLKSMQAHAESKHPKLEFEEDDYIDMHAAVGGVTTKGVAVRGGFAAKNHHA